MASVSRLRRMRPLIAVATVVLVVGLGVTAAVALGSSSSHSYRTATVTRGMVAQRLPGTGTIQPVSQASIAFPIAGVVSSVSVKTGDRVTAGQQLASLDASVVTAAGDHEAGGARGREPHPLQSPERRVVERLIVEWRRPDDGRREHGQYQLGDE